MSAVPLENGFMDQPEDSFAVGSQLEPPARRLLGLRLPNGYTVTGTAPPNANSTGGNFSVGYVAEKEGKKYFVKALDYSSALGAERPALLLQHLTAAYNHESAICFLCKERRLSRVVLPVEANKVLVDSNSPIGTVEYIIFEKADGDARSTLSKLAVFDSAWALRALHGAATALTQLHGVGIAHQDVKPSNVLLFPEVGAKLGDLGRSTQAGRPAEHDSFAIPGDPKYAPPELLYNALPTTWQLRRNGCDAYMFGNLVVFFFANANMSTLLLHALEKPYRPMEWTGSYEELLPYLIDAYSQVLADFAATLPIQFRQELLRIVYELCYPDPTKRGHPKNRAGSQFSLERYVSLLDRLARSAERELKRR